MDTPLSVTQLLNEYRDGDEHCLPELFSVVYQELRKIASREKRRFNNADTINTAALVNEAYLKLWQQQALGFENRAHFLAVSAMAMRQILINYVEQKCAQKRGGDQVCVTLSSLAMATDVDVVTLLSIDRALNELQQIDAQLASLVEMRFFAGMTEAEIADVLQITERSVRRNWRKAKGLLQQILEIAHPG